MAEQVPLRARLFELQSDEHVLVVVVHHIAGDGISMGPLARDVMTAYTARTQGGAPGWAPLAVQYADFALWQREVLGAEDDPQSLLARQIAYWQDTLDGVPDELPLPADRPRPAVASHRGATLGRTLAPELVSGLEELARQRNSSLFMVVHAALAVLLARLSGADDIAVGTPIAGRGEAALDDLVGMFVNTLVLRTEIDRAESFATLLERVRHVDLDAFGNADVPFERLVDVLAPERSQARNPLFQVALSFQNMERATLELPGLTVVGAGARRARRPLRPAVHAVGAGPGADVAGSDLCHGSVRRGHRRFHRGAAGSRYSRPCWPIPRPRRHDRHSRRRRTCRPGLAVPAARRCPVGGCPICWPPRSSGTRWARPSCTVTSG